MSVTQEALDTLGVQQHVISLHGESRLKRIMSALHLMDYTSLFMAQQAGVDANPVQLVEAFKRRLGAVDEGESEG